MTQRKISPEHDFWHKHLEPAIREVMKVHPEWFALDGAEAMKVCTNSIAKRVVGQVIAALRERERIAARKIDMLSAGGGLTFK